ncbi:hypothetical protein ACN4EK_28340, partial [Pantanalinema rosaneae CENA516]|uniref:hypothetical protein n=1 Tax=Pantanalinema rosaneae TaxID=1620701 RepID=UPI003D6E9795
DVYKRQVPKASPPQLSPQASPPLSAPPSPTTPFTPYSAPVELTDVDQSTPTTDSSLPAWLGWVVVGVAIGLAGIIYQLLMRKRRSPAAVDAVVPLYEAQVEESPVESPTIRHGWLDSTSDPEGTIEPPEPPQIP